MVSMRSGLFDRSLRTVAGGLGFVSFINMVSIFHVVSVSFLLLFLLKFPIYLSLIHLVLATILSLLVHETGHLVVAYGMRIGVENIAFTRTGIGLHLRDDEFEASSPMVRISIYAAGYTFNLLSVAVAVIIYQIWPTEFISAFAFMGMLLYFLNAQISKNTDGWKIALEITSTDYADALGYGLVLSVFLTPIIILLIVFTTLGWI